MKRRSFLSLLCAATAAPALPAGGIAAKTATYNRMTYGYAVFHARHGGAFGAQELATAMKVSTGQAKAMLAEMSRDGIIRPAFGNMVEAVQVHGGRKGGMGFLRKATQTAKELIEHIEKLADTNDAASDDTPEISTMQSPDVSETDDLRFPLTTEEPRKEKQHG